MILIDYKSIVLKMNELIRMARGVSEEISRMEEELEELGIFWDSEAMEEYALRLNADLYNARALIERIKNSIRMLYEAIKTFDNAERQVMDMIEGM